ncbi:MAG: hypothetical protein D9N11_00700 [Ketobacter sp.]|nr:MAG: hypothetical protein D9N11_00700 [Ketobacter sp.]
MTRIGCLTLMLVGLSVVLPAMAEVKCFPEAIKSIEVAKGGDLFYTTVSGVRRKLTHMSQHEAPAMLDILRGSIGTDQIIQVIYPDGYNCKQPDLEVHAERLKMQAPLVR